MLKINIVWQVYNHTNWLPATWCFQPDQTWPFWNNYYVIWILFFYICKLYSNASLWNLIFPFLFSGGTSIIRVVTLLSCKMILHHKLPLISIICRISSLLHTTKYRVHQNQSKSFRTLVISESKYTSTKFETRWYLHLLSITISCLQYLLKKSASVEEAVLFWIFLMGRISFHCYIYARETKPTEITLYINSLYQLESMFENITPVNFNKSFQTRMAVIVMHCVIFCVTIFPFVVTYALHWRNPCKATLVGFWMLEECLGGEQNLSLIIPSMVLKVLVFLANHWVWAYGLQGVLFGVLVINTLAIISLHELTGR